MTDAARPIYWAPNYTYAEISPLIPAEHVPENLLALGVKAAQRIATPSKQLYSLASRLFELGINIGDQGILNTAWHTYEAYPDDDFVKIKLSNHIDSFPFFEARGERRQPTDGEVTHVENDLRASLRSTREVLLGGTEGLRDIYPHISQTVAEGHISQLRGVAAESIGVLLGAHNFRSGRGDIVMPSSEREEMPLEPVLKTVGHVQHSLHTYNPQDTAHRGAIGVKTNKGTTTTKLPEFRLMPATRRILQDMTKDTEFSRNVTIPDVIDYLGQANTDGDSVTFSTQFRDKLSAHIQEKLAASRAVQDQLRRG